MIPYAKQSISREDIKAVTEVLKRDFITRGPVVKEFEEEISSYCGSKFAVAFNSATSGLIAACYAGEVTPNDRLITSPNTFIGTVAGGYYKGAEPVFVDIDHLTGNIDLDLLKFSSEYTSSRGKNVYIPVHFSGIPVDMKKVEGMITDPNSIIVEDAAHALGSRYSDGSKVGSCKWSDMTVFSFHPAKNITSGEGGVVTTNSEHLYRLLCQFRDNGIVRDPKYFIGQNSACYYEVQDVTGNYHMTDIHAALGLSQFKRLDLFGNKRRELVQLYRELLKDEESIQFLEVDNHDDVMYHLCVVLIDFGSLGLTKSEVMVSLKEQGVGTQVHYIPLYRHPFFTKGHRQVDQYFPEMEKYYDRCLSLPLYYDLTEKDVKKVVKTLKKVLQNC
ncbi:MAG: UDP-4-amino-4,6-dideoxy-N-acetyl-beta-L-altrosamine transaminase [Chlamydiota bacterium]